MTTGTPLAGINNSQNSGALVPGQFGGAIQPTAPVVPAQPQNQAGGQYTIQPGDTIDALAAKFGVTPQALLQMNPNITNPNMIISGKSLNVPGGGTTAQAGQMVNEQGGTQTPPVGGTTGTTSAPGTGTTTPGSTTAPQTPASSTTGSTTGSPAQPSGNYPGTNIPMVTGNPFLDSTLNSEQNIQGNVYTQMQATNNLVTQMTQNIQPFLSSSQQQIVNVIQQTTQNTVQATQASVNSQTAMIRYDLAKRGVTQTSPATAASELNLSMQSGALAVQQAQNSGTLALANYEQSVQAGDIQAARDNFNEYQKASEDMTANLQNMYTAISTYQNNQTKNEIAEGRLINEENALAETIRYQTADIGIKGAALNQAWEIANLPSTSTQQNPTLFNSILDNFTQGSISKTTTTQKGYGDNTYGLDFSD